MVKPCFASSRYSGIGLYGVGSGTTIDHVQIHRSAADGLTIAGGQIDLTHILSTDNEDDALDISQGYIGSAQYVLLTQRNDIADNAIELDGCTDADESNAPCSDPVLTNFTILGKQGTSKKGLLTLRQSGGIQLLNSYIAHYKDRTIMVDSSSVTNDANVNLRFSANIIECLEHSELTTVTLDNLVCNATGEDVGGVCTFSSGNPTDSITFTSQFPDQNMGNETSTQSINGTGTIECTSPKITMPESALWGATSGASEFIPSANITTSMGLYADPQAAGSGKDINGVDSIGAFKSTDTWANDWTSFPVN